MFKANRKHNISNNMRTTQGNTQRWCDAFRLGFFRDTLSALDEDISG